MPTASTAWPPADRSSRQPFHAPTCLLRHNQWKYLYRAVDKLGQTVDFLLTARRDLAAARRFFERAIDLHVAP